MDQTDQHISREDLGEEPGPFRKYGWVLALLALILLVLCGVVGVQASSNLDLSFLSRLRGGAGGPAPTFIPAQSDKPAATATELPTTAPSDTPPPSDAPTVTATATRRPSVALSCSCDGPDWVCNDGSAVYNSPKCVTAVTPTCGCQSHDWVCSDGTTSVNDLRCGVVCACQGNDLVCNDGTVGIYNPQCACKCDGTTLVCNDGGRQENAPYCKKKK